VIGISGDQTACAEATELLGPVATAVVKQASGRMAAECLAPEVARQAIYEAAERAVRRLRDGDAPPPLRFEEPVTVALELIHSDMADRAAILPGAQRLAGRRVEIVVDDAATAYRAFRSAVALARE
jgi:D-amino peptidase